MVTQELISFIKQKLASGETKEAITAELLKSNWSEQDINQAFTTIDQNIPVPPQPTPTVPQSSNDQTHLIITIVAFLICYPVGVICMWVWMKHWPKWVKILLALPIFLIILLPIIL